MSLIEVSANSRVCAIACAIVGVIHDHERAEVYAIGEEAINQALKATDLTIVYFKRREIDIQCVMESAKETIDAETHPAIKLIIEPQSSLDRPFELTRQFPILD
jgi:stage V sporulation protein SpoVS